jgi:hypothetical protein
LVGWNGCRYGRTLRDILGSSGQALSDADYWDFLAMRLILAATNMTSGEAMKPLLGKMLRDYFKNTGYPPLETYRRVYERLDREDVAQSNRNFVLLEDAANRACAFLNAPRFLMTVIDDQKLSSMWKLSRLFCQPFLETYSVPTLSIRTQSSLPLPVGAHFCSPVMHRPVSTHAERLAFTHITPPSKQ